MASGKLQTPYPYSNVFFIFHKCLQSFSSFSFTVLSYAYFPYTCSIKHLYCITKFNWYLFGSCNLELASVAVDYKQGIFISFGKNEWKFYINLVSSYFALYISYVMVTYIVNIKNKCNHVCIEDINIKSTFLDQALWKFWVLYNNSYIRCFHMQLLIHKISIMNNYKSLHYLKNVPKRQ